MIRPPPTSPLFPSTPLFRSLAFRIRTRRLRSRGHSHQESRKVRALVRPHLRSQSPGNGDIQGATRDLRRDRKSTRLNSSYPSISYAVFCLKKKKKNDSRALS